jgi:hypothetical protein
LVSRRKQPVFVPPTPDEKAEQELIAQALKESIEEQKLYRDQKR